MKMELTLTNNFNKYQSATKLQGQIPHEVLNNVEQALINYVYLDSLTNSKRKTYKKHPKDQRVK